MGYLPDATVALFRSSINLGLFFHLETSPPLRLWAGSGDVPHHLPNVDLGDQVYRGVRLGNFDDFEVMLNGGAERGTFTLEGVSDEAAREISGLDPPVVGKTLHIGIAAFDEHWQRVTDILPLSDPVADFWAMNGAMAKPGESPTRTITLSVGFGETGRARPRRAVYSDAQQQAYFPGDTFCIDVPRYHQGFIIAWPRF